MQPAPAYAAAWPLCAALLLQSAAAFQVWLSTAHLPADLAARADEWPEAQGLIEGLIGPATPDGGDGATLLQSFGDVPRIAAQPWAEWAPVNGAGALQGFAGAGFDADEVFLAGPPAAPTLSLEQLDTVAQSPVVDDTLIRVRSFGPMLQNKDLLAQSIDHPACSGAVMQASAGYWCAAADSPNQPHFAAARYTAAAGKRLFVMPPPPAADADTAPPQQMECLADALHAALGSDFFCSGGLHIVASADAALPLLPERTAAGGAAATFTGSILALQAKRSELCADATDAAVAGATSEGAPAPEVAAPAPAEQDDSQRVHASGLTAEQVVAQIRRQRQAGANTKVTVRTRRLRRGRRMRGTARTSSPPVATQIVAVDEEGDEIDSGGDGGVGGEVEGVRVYAGASSGGGGSEEDGPPEGSGERSWWKCMQDCMKGCCDGMKACMKACCEGMEACMKACCDGMKACCEAMKDGMKACCEGMEDCMKACCDGMKACCEAMKDGIKACCEGMKDCMKACCEAMKDGMKACCEGMKDCMKACCDGMKACCEGMKGCMKACCEGVASAAKSMCDCVKAACKCVKKVVFTEEADEHEA